MSGFGDNSYSYVEHQRMLRETFGMDAASKAAYLDGLMAGMMGFPTDHLTGAALVGYATGSAGKAKSEELRKRKVEAGKRSAEVRNEKNGSSDPRANREQNVNTVPNTVPESVREDREQNVNVGRKEGRKEERKEANASSFSTTAPSTSARETATRPAAQGAADARAKTAIRPNPRAKPDRMTFVAYAAQEWPRWRSEFPAAIWDRWHGRGWKVPNRDGAMEPIGNWVRLLTDFRQGADPSEFGETLPLGSITRTAAPDLSSMRFQA